MTLVFETEGIQSEGTPYYHSHSRWKQWSEANGYNTEIMSKQQCDQEYCAFWPKRKIFKYKYGALEQLNIHNAIATELWKG